MSDANTLYTLSEKYNAEWIVTKSNEVNRCYSFRIKQNKYVNYYCELQEIESVDSCMYEYRLIVENEIEYTHYQPFVKIHSLKYETENEFCERIMPFIQLLESGSLTY